MHGKTYEFGTPYRIKVPWRRLHVGLIQADIKEDFGIRRGNLRWISVNIVDTLGGWRRTSGTCWVSVMLTCWYIGNRWRWISGKGYIETGWGSVGIRKPLGGYRQTSGAHQVGIERYLNNVHVGWIFAGARNILAGYRQIWGHIGQRSLDVEETQEDVPDVRWVSVFVMSYFTHWVDITQPGDSWWRAAVEMMPNLCWSFIPWRKVGVELQSTSDTSRQ